jgi:hypothetical protein
VTTFYQAEFSTPKNTQHMKQHSKQHSILRRVFKALTVLAFCVFAFLGKAAAQDSADKARLQQVLQSYYSVKDALVSGNSGAAAAGATSFIRNLNGISYLIISEGNVEALAKDAGAIAATNDIAKQRQHFANFSANMAEVAKSLKLSQEPIYLQYCPMKKASWLSHEKAIKNPYYGSAMLTCGSVKETIE